MTEELIQLLEQLEQANSERGTHAHFSFNPEKETHKWSVQLFYRYGSNLFGSFVKVEGTSLEAALWAALKNQLPFNPALVETTRKKGGKEKLDIENLLQSL